MSQDAQQILREFVGRYGPPAGANGPTDFVRNVFGVTLDPWQERTLEAIGRGERRITIRACHGPGKTALAAWIIWHRMTCFFPQKTVATAPTKSQLEDVLLAEVTKWGNRLPDALKTLFHTDGGGVELLEAPKESFFSARTARAETPEALQGVHSDDGFVLLIADEASGVPEKIFEAAIGSMAGHNATTLLLSNPTRSTGFFFNSHKPGSSWFRVHVSQKDSPRVPDSFVQEVIEAYGEDSSAYRVRVLGEFPKADLDTVIPFELVESARTRELILRPGMETVWGLDVARFGDDACALVKRNARAVLPGIQVWQHTDLMVTAGRIKAEWDATPPSERPIEILIDVIGYGAGVCDRLYELKLPARGINVSESPVMRDRYRNMRSELWFRMREWLEKRDTVLPSNLRAPKAPEEQLVAELTAPRYTFTSSGRVMVESKADMRKRGHKSPNIADALMMTFASEPAAVVHGQSGPGGWSTVGWNEPISRKRSRV